MDSPPFETTSQRNIEARITFLRDQLAVEAPCVDLAIAQDLFETLQIETATLHLIEQKRSLTTGFVADALNYRFHLHKSRSSKVRKHE